MQLRPIHLSVLLAALAAPSLAQSGGGFSLEPGPTPTATQGSAVQGPVDTEGPIPVRPRVIATPTPTPSATQQPQQTGTPVRLPDPEPAVPSTSQRPTADRPPPTAASTVSPAPIEAPVAQQEKALGEQATPPTQQSDAPLAPPGPQASATASSQTPSADTDNSWSLILVAGLALVVGAIAVLLWRRRRPETVPEFVAPVVGPQTERNRLKLDVTALRMDRSLMNATVAYRVTIHNPSTRALSNVVVEGDLVSATRNRSLEGQVASPDAPLPVRHQAERIAPGGSQRFEGQLRLALSEVTAIRQGNVALLVPLMRIRAGAEGIDPVATTLVIGQGTGARPQPFRLDEPPRSFAPLAQRKLDSAAMAV